MLDIRTSQKSAVSSDPLPHPGFARLSSVDLPVLGDTIEPAFHTSFIPDKTGTLEYYTTVRYEERDLNMLCAFCTRSGSALVYVKM